MLGPVFCLLAHAPSGTGLVLRDIWLPPLRLVFHDCIPYTDGTGGCDGCMNWQGMDAETPDPNKEAHKYKFDPVNATDNKALFSDLLRT